ncbi:bifunctional sugar phosphate isomerase/epimerase/4-hydroxyphenylpyruvate dioxygenase family protein [uncultured Kocuria sp.]|uniref:bifunctional sugar phosphate isomerase/epimerase/4-hydroxyphenylpyruvate dioxygenase family protein n=1 Tax=uncultured Kocuria sp. TaxID=259305 RepID=UPI00261252B1|nr:sugar phosphate isomerase/epimerase and 4-hydroxyphenylpyruvate domain-containing protein [uncultured Kocuria sp.]
MRTSIATVCLSGTLEEKMHAAAAAGFDGIEVFEQDLVVSPSSPEQIRELAGQLGLSLDLYQPFRDFEAVGPERLAANLRRAEAKFRLMDRLGVRTVLVCSNVATAEIDDDEVVAGQLRQLGELAARHGVRLAYEALAWGKFVDDFEHAQRIVDLADHPSVGTCLDSFHILSRVWDPAPIEGIAAEKIFFVQLADAPLLSLDVLSWSRHHRVFPGEGDFDMVGFMSHLVRAGYDGPVSLEIFNDAFRQADVNRTAVDGLRSLRWLEDQTRRALAGGRTRDTLELQALPAVEEPSGYDFVEIRTGRLGETTRLLHQLGFALGGHHQSKENVQVWVQGPVRVVVNDAVPEGSPTEVAALGFDVADPAAAVERAARLKALPVPRSQGPGEQVLRGVFAPDGTEIFFCERTADGVPVWLGEFGADDELETGALVTGVDHLNMAQPWQHYDEAVLFYTSVLALEAQASQDVPGPSGLVRSQVMRSANGAVRMPLNVAPTAAEQGSFVGAAYPEHVALSCTDVFAVARRARRRGLRFLPVPQNYYEDLDARFDLDAGFVAALQELHLLYDRDAEGEFLHFYTETLGTVFFEVVERRNGYSGFGAPNAPVRLAAQYRRSQAAHRARTEA